MKDKMKMNQNKFTIDKGEIMRRRMDQNQNLNESGGIMQKSKTRTIQALLLAFILATFALWMGPAVAAEKKMVKDPSTGKMVTAPEYGGTITFVFKTEPAGPDVYVSGGAACGYVAGVLEKLAIADWATPRDEIPSFAFPFSPSHMKGALAESWSQPDPLTYIFNIRKGVNWHDKAPMNGREFTADDIEYNFHRLLGTGSGFTEPIPYGGTFGGMKFESVTATDRYTVVFKMKEQNLGALYAIMDNYSSWIYPPEVIKEHGDVTDWRNLVGTGPMMLTDWTAGSSVTWTKNPDYWGYDDKFPENRLPYVDQIRTLFMPEVATYMAAMRTGRVDYIGRTGGAQMRTFDEVDSLRKTNPEIVIWPFTGRSNNGFGMNNQIEAFSDIRVRKAMQMAINIEEINNAYYRGEAATIPQGQLNRSFTDVATPFEEWPEDVKKVFDYDPEGAEALLDEAGYPRGDDGIRFKTKLMHLARYDVNYAQLAASYWGKIGIDVEIEIEPIAPFSSRRSARDFEMINAEMANTALTAVGWGLGRVRDPVAEAMYEAVKTATTLEEQNRIAGELDQYAIEKFWTIWGPFPPDYLAVQPWVMGYNVEHELGWGQTTTLFTRLWIDQDLKEAMGR